MRVLKKHIPIIIIFFVYTLLAILVSLNRYWQYSAFYYDLGIFDQAIWRVSRFLPPVIDHHIVGGKIIFADHFNPSIFLFSPLFWFTDKTEILLIFQVLWVVISAAVMYLIALKILPKQKIIAISLTIAYLGYVGLQNALITDFHDATVAVLPLSLIFWSIINNKIKLYWLFLIILLGFKESMAGLTFGIGIYLIFKKNPARLKGILTILFSLFWAYLTTKILIPYFSQGKYYYEAVYPNSLPALIDGMFSPTIKIKTMFYSFASFGFLPLLYLPLWPAIFENFFERFVLINSAARWDLGLHYNAPLSPLMFMASLLVLKKINSWSSKAANLISILIIVIILIFHRFTLHGPLALAYNPAFYQTTKENAFLNEFIKEIPKNGLLMTQQNLATRFTHNCVILFKNNYQNYQPDYIAMDLRDGQNPTNFFPLRDTEVKLLFEDLKRDSDYRLKKETDTSFIFTRIKNKKLHPEYCPYEKVTKNK